jgi:hypothetical protein
MLAADSVTTGNGLNRYKTIPYTESTDDEEAEEGEEEEEEEEEEEGGEGGEEGGDEDDDTDQREGMDDDENSDGGVHERGSREREEENDGAADWSSNDEHANMRGRERTSRGSRINYTEFSDDGVEEGTDNATEDNEEDDEAEEEEEEDYDATNDDNGMEEDSEPDSNTAGSEEGGDDGDDGEDGEDGEEGDPSADEINGLATHHNLVHDGFILPSKFTLQGEGFTFQVSTTDAPKHKRTKAHAAEVFASLIGQINKQPTRVLTGLGLKQQQAQAGLQKRQAQQQPHHYHHQQHQQGAPINLRRKSPKIRPVLPSRADRSVATGGVLDGAGKIDEASEASDGGRAAVHHTAAARGAGARIVDVNATTFTIPGRGRRLCPTCSRSGTKLYYPVACRTCPFCMSRKETPDADADTDADSDSDSDAADVDVDVDVEADVTGGEDVRDANGRVAFDCEKCLFPNRKRRHTCKATHTCMCSCGAGFERAQSLFSHKARCAVWRANPLCGQRKDRGVGGDARSVPLGRSVARHYNSEDGASSAPVVGSTVRVCGSDGCEFADFHLGPHSFELTTQRRNANVGRHAMERTACMCMGCGKRFRSLHAFSAHLRDDVGSCIASMHAAIGSTTLTETDEDDYDDYDDGDDGDDDNVDTGAEDYDASGDDDAPNFLESETAYK